MEKLTLQPLSEKDLELLYSWLSVPHVAKYWQGPSTRADFQKQYLQYIKSGDNFHYLVYINRKPIAYIQYYLIDKSTVGIDHFIGDIAYLNKPYDVVLVAAFVQELFFDPTIKKIICNVAPTNTTAIACYEKVGFKKIASTKDLVSMELARQTSFTDAWAIVMKQIRSEIGRTLFDALHKKLMLNTQKDKQPTNKQLVSVYKTLAGHWNSIIPSDKTLILNYLLDMTALTPEERQLFEESFGESVMIHGNTAVFIAPRVPGGILELRIQVGISSKYNPQGIVLQRDAPGSYNLPEAFEKIQDDIIDNAKQQVQVQVDVTPSTAPDLTVQQKTNRPH